MPTATTKGVLVAPTVFGNVMLGPTADDIDDFSDRLHRDGLDRLLAQGRRILPALLDEEVTAVYAGLRAATEHSDYQLSAEPAARYVGLGGIRSTGLTASMALAEEAMVLLAQVGASSGAEAAGRPAPRSRSRRSAGTTGRRVTAAARRPDRVSLRTGRRGRARRAACRGPLAGHDDRRAAPADPSAERAMPGLLLLGRGRDHHGFPMTPSYASMAPGELGLDVLVVGGGPAGLAAAIELRRLGAGRVVVAEREHALGGIARHSVHTGYGLRDLHRVMGGPALCGSLHRPGRASRCRAAVRRRR